jgi:hypothetical protein
VTQAYFEQKDFDQKEILKELFVQLSMCVSLQVPNSIPLPRTALAYLQEESQLYMGLSARDLVLRFRHHFLLLVKLLLLERKVLFYGCPSLTPVLTLSEIIMTLLSLLPKMLDDGLHYACETQEEDVFDDFRNDELFMNDETVFSVKSGVQSLSEDYLVVTRYVCPDEKSESDAVVCHDDIVSDASVSDSGIDRERPISSAGLTDVHLNSGKAGTLTVTVLQVGTNGREKEDSGLSGSGESLLPTSKRNQKASLKAPTHKKMVMGSSSPLLLPSKEEFLRKEDLFDPETQSLSSLCVEPPLSVNDNLEDRMDDLSLDEEDFGTDIPTDVEEEVVDVGSVVSITSDHVSVVEPQDNGEDALLDEIDQMMSASSKGKVSSMIWQTLNG